MSQDALHKAVDSGAFEVVILETKDGRFVQSVLIPTYHPRAPMLMWGSRTFLNIAPNPVYREDMMIMVLPIAGVTENGL